ncbi:initiator tRNA phosphoribosyl transferase [Cryphonectria parasitica EP155]|uniref:Initiator tRNA phosphoribosyl transferase n=1 Tax=Cryphonectria parasitica (strain ATCC 38755 / EP155) TaxID=660469 RepID=A0A9P4YDC4_CRYP1|nr:initiator tRNA phosphoribosyl transferase [Cryphonectria parasitica EP155]KAF3770802.1 initiator tRNA phosphoribosyl transferase [Cryphonectria parasitica EP155]
MTSLSDILFPSQAADAAGNHNINRILGDLKRSNLSITNRLRSVQQDADFVDEVAAAFGGGRRPLIANERCGSWYIRPGAKGGSAYFKSTDGHTGQWRFSTRRLNLHLLPIIERCDGIIIVDSTRRGKRMPDALSKTIPIWCCVLNRALFPDQPEFHNLYVPPNAVSDSEKSQALARIPEGLAAFKELNLDLDSLCAQISKPLRPTWVTQETALGHLQTGEDDGDGGGDGGAEHIFDDFRPVICCTSSRRVAGGEMSGHTGYIQGAGDDTENWAHGLEPPVFWANADELLSTPEADLPDLIRSLVASAKRHPLEEENTTTEDGSGGIASSTADLPPAARQLTPQLHVSPLPIPQRLMGDPTWFTVALLPSPTPAETWPRSPTHMEVGLGKHKVASRNLRAALPSICDSALRFLHSDDDNSRNPAEEEGDQHDEHDNPPPLRRRRILVACDTGGRDLSVGVALALLCWCFEDDSSGAAAAAAGGGGGGGGTVSFNKSLIKIRLGRIMTTMPDANPNRATLQSVNSFLMDWRK